MPVRIFQSPCPAVSYNPRLSNFSGFIPFIGTPLLVRTREKNVDYLSWRLQWNPKHSSISIAHFISWENYRLNPSEVEIKWIKNRASTFNKSALANEKETRTFQLTHVNISIRRATQPSLKIQKSYKRFLRQGSKAIEARQRHAQGSWGSGCVGARGQSPWKILRFGC